MRKPELNNSFDQKGLSYKQAGQQEQGKWIKVMLMHNLCDGIFCNAPYYGLPPTGFWVVILTDSPCSQWFCHNSKVLLLANSKADVLRDEVK